MKKFNTIVLLAAMGIMLTACSSGTPATTTATSTEATTTEATTAATTEAAAETESEAENTDAAEPEAPAENPLQGLADAAITAGEWPALAEVADKQVISDYFTIDIDANNFESYIFMQCPMSANLSELIIIKSTDVDAAKTALTGRQKKAQETDAFYPADVERAGASIVGSEGDYAYFIMCDGSSEAEAALVNAIKAL